MSCFDNLNVSIEPIFFHLQQPPHESVAAGTIVDEVVVEVGVGVAVREAQDDSEPAAAEGSHSHGTCQSSRQLEERERGEEEDGGGEGGDKEMERDMQRKDCTSVGQEFDQSRQVISRTAYTPTSGPVAPYSDATVVSTFPPPPLYHHTQFTGSVAAAGDVNGSGAVFEVDEEHYRNLAPYQSSGRVYNQEEHEVNHHQERDIHRELYDSSWEYYYHHYYPEGLEERAPPAPDGLYHHSVESVHHHHSHESAPNILSKYYASSFDDMIANMNQYVTSYHHQHQQGTNTGWDSGGMGYAAQNYYYQAGYPAQDYTPPPPYFSSSSPSSHFVPEVEQITPPDSNQQYGGVVGYSDGQAYDFPPIRSDCMYEKFANYPEAARQPPPPLLTSAPHSDTFQNDQHTGDQYAYPESYNCVELTDHRSHPENALSAAEVQPRGPLIYQDQDEIDDPEHPAAQHHHSDLNSDCLVCHFGAEETHYQHDQDHSMSLDAAHDTGHDQTLRFDENYDTQADYRDDQDNQSAHHTLRDLIREQENFYQTNPVKPAKSPTIKIDRSHPLLRPPNRGRKKKKTAGSVGSSSSRKKKSRRAKKRTSMITNEGSNDSMTEVLDNESFGEAKCEEEQLEEATMDDVMPPKSICLFLDMDSMMAIKEYDGLVQLLKLVVGPIRTDNASKKSNLSSSIVLFTRDEEHYNFLCKEYQDYYAGAEDIKSEEEKQGLIQIWSETHPVPLDSSNSRERFCRTSEGEYHECEDDDEEDVEDKLCRIAAEDDDRRQRKSRNLPRAGSRERDGDDASTGDADSITIESRIVRHSSNQVGLIVTHSESLDLDMDEETEIFHYFHNGSLTSITKLIENVFLEFDLKI